jgi:hypothetical protein
MAFFFSNLSHWLLALGSQIGNFPPAEQKQLTLPAYSSI